MTPQPASSIPLPPPGRLPIPELLTPIEVADTLKISKSMVYEMINAGELETVLIGASGKTRRISAAVLADYIQSNSCTLRR